MILQHFFRPALAALILLFIVGCGGSGSDSSAPLANMAAPPTANAPIDQTGVVGIIIKDAPTGAYTRIMMRITSVELLGNGDPEVVFDGDLTFDLLALRNHSDLLALSDVVPVGDYDKIRLRVSSITLWCIDENGDEVPANVPVPANGKVDLNPRGTFTVAADSAILIQIDLDAKKSIHVVTTGNGGYRFRPVVFVDIDEHQIPEGLVRVSGDVGAIHTDPDWFDLCNLDVHLDSDSDDCIRVNVDSDTSLFDADGAPIDFADLIGGEAVTVFASAIVVPVGDDDDDSIRIVQLAAFVVHQGAPDSILSLDGTVASAPDSDDLFQFDVTAGQELPEETIDVQLLDSTRILSGEDLSDLDASAIDVDVLAEVSGTLQPGIPENPQRLNAALIVIGDDEEEAEGPTELEGSIQSLDTETFVLFAENEDPPGDRCVAPLTDANYIVISDGGSEQTEVEASYLDEGQEITAFGAYAAGGDCFEADVILIDENEDDDDDD